jgi:hypothetical protein
VSSTTPRIVPEKRSHRALRVREVAADVQEDQALAGGPLLEVLQGPVRVAEQFPAERVALRHALHLAPGCRGD